MSTEPNNAPASTVAANIRSGRKAVGTAVAAVTLAAVTVLGASGMTGGTGLDAASIITSPPNSASSRIAGVQEDMARAVQLQQITPEQAAFLERQLVRRIQNDTGAV
ncbi:hypothetical protein JOF48_001993 [Arthrobacter stackebrandtii]|uniref:Peptidylprolyl isomerase n=1 Tax=Arthrobacter stackebrandtii TaxID=272161 RepID=A0ABS4YWS0_9MICC|nr:hypothetical protein [Arthrobacter stackebrandtii]MBP2413194.1 hypothetical protein [Arthrobacter stackebrandtii]PYH01052.1 hypothetical protein CVV67_05470 [Arthrobacter stackebrandtii]